MMFNGSKRKKKCVFQMQRSKISARAINVHALYYLI